MTQESCPSDLYFDLLKRVLINLPYEDGRYPTGHFDYNLRIEGMDWPLEAHTMLGVNRLDNIHECAKRVILDKIQGDFIECGAWRGGAAIFMQGIREFYNEDRTVWVADSFNGFPVSVMEMKLSSKLQNHQKYHTVPLNEVKDNFNRYGLLNDHVKFLEGFVNETLHKAPIDKLALIHCDVDMYPAVYCVLQHLYPKLSKGGFCIIDDYSLIGCRQAVNDYRRRKDITEEIIPIDWTGVYWRKA